MDKIEGKSISKFNEFMNDAMIVEETERGGDYFLIDYLLVYIRGNQVEKIELGNKSYSMEFTRTNDSLNCLHIDIGENKKDGSYTFKW